MHPRARQTGGREAQTDLDALDGGDREEGGREPGAEPAIALDVAAHAGGKAEDHDFEHAAQRVALAARPRRWPPACRALGAGVETAQRVGVDLREGGRRRRRGDDASTLADRYDVAAHGAAQHVEQSARDRAAGDPRGGLARAGALDHVAQVARAVELRPGQIGVARPRHANRLDRRDVASTASVSSQFAASRFSMARAIGAPVVRPYLTPARMATRSLLDLLAGAAPIAELAPGKVGVDRRRVEGQTGRAALDDGGELAAVRLAGREVAERGHARYLTRRQTRQRETIEGGPLATARPQWRALVVAVVGARSTWTRTVRLAA